MQLHDPPQAVAVLPFENVTGTEEGELFAAGLHDGLLTELSRVPGLTVIARTSVLACAGTPQSVPVIARALNAGTVVEGGVQISGGRVRLHVRLVDAHTGTQRWAERYDRELSASGIFGIQTELATRISDVLQTDSAPQPAAEPTSDIEAYRLYVLGRWRVDQRTHAGMREALGHFRSAIALDEEYALAWAGLADALTLLFDYGYEAAAAVLPDAERAARRALELDPLRGEALTSLALLQFNRRRGPAALDLFRRAIRLRPGYSPAHNWLSWSCQVLGMAEQALASARRAVELDPLHAEALSNLSVSSLENGRLDDALIEARRAGEVQPGWTTPPFYEALALYHLGRHREVIRILDGLDVRWAGSGAPLTRALSHAALGETGPARELLEEFRAHDDRFAAGVLLLALGEREHAVQLLERVEDWSYWPALATHHFYPDVLGPLRGGSLHDTMTERARAAWSLEA